MGVEGVAPRESQVVELLSRFWTLNSKNLTTEGLCKNLSISQAGVQLGIV